MQSRKVLLCGFVFGVKKGLPQKAQNVHRKVCVHSVPSVAIVLSPAVSHKKSRRISGSFSV